MIAVSYRKDPIQRVTNRIWCLTPVENLKSQPILMNCSTTHFGRRCECQRASTQINTSNTCTYVNSILSSIIRLSTIEVLISSLCCAFAGNFGSLITVRNSSVFRPLDLLYDPENHLSLVAVYSGVHFVSVSQLLPSSYESLPRYPSVR